jgi:choline dehydrogenase-like flavoprotein
MITDLNQVDLDPFNEKIFDFCICGAGVAGITLALKLSRKFDVVLLEGGGLEYSDNSQDLYRGTNAGAAYFPLDATRLRYFGGTSNHWAGWCIPMDGHDFVPKAYVEYSGWPIERADLDPYLIEAESILDLPQLGGDPHNIYAWNAENLIVASDDLRAIEYKWSVPTRLGEKFRPTIRRSESLTCYLNANVVDLRLHENMARLDTVEVRDFSDHSYNVRAKTYILAAGGIENPRILLNSNRQLKNGLGNENGLVGRFFTEHNNKNIGQFLLEDDASESLFRSWAPSWKQNYRYFAPTAAFMERDRILNFGIIVEPVGRPSPKRSFQDSMRNLLCEIDWVKDVVGGVMPSCPSDGVIRIVSEQALNPSSRVHLGSEVDRFGMRRVILEWKQSEIDKRTIQRAAIRLAEIFAESGIGRVRIKDWVLTDDLDFPADDGIAGNHHMCTTRMSDSPRDGVVDEYQKIFGIDNLYVGGSSVFSTAGHDSPTITIVQMTLRLADYLQHAR